MESPINQVVQDGATVHQQCVIFQLDSGVMTRPKSLGHHLGPWIQNVLITKQLFIDCQPCLKHQLFINLSSTLDITKRNQ